MSSRAGGCAEERGTSPARERSLTLYAFSSDNWNRPRPEVDALMTFLQRFLLAETAELHFSDRLWPDFCGDDLARAITDYQGRHRRFGAIPSDDPAVMVSHG